MIFEAPCASGYCDWYYLSLVQFHWSMIIIVSCVFQGSDEMRKIPVPAHRYTPLKENWLKIFTPIVENLQLQVRFNLKTRNVEIKVSLTSKMQFPFTGAQCS